MPSKTKGLTEVQFLALLEKALGKVMNDAHLRTAIYDAVTKEIKLHNNVASFTKFCAEGSVPDLKPETVTDLQNQLISSFGEDAQVALVPDEEGGKAMAVEITLPDRTITSQVKVQPEGPIEEEAPKAPFVPFPVTLPQDDELIWVLARREDLGPDEAARALASIEEEFWASKNGQKLLREHTERNFAEFIANVPAAALLESGLKRHYKEPETLQTLRLVGTGQPGERDAAPAKAAGKDKAPAANKATTEDQAPVRAKATTGDKAAADEATAEDKAPVDEYSHDTEIVAPWD